MSENQIYVDRSGGQRPKIKYMLINVAVNIRESNICWSKWRFLLLSNYFYIDLNLLFLFFSELAVTKSSHVETMNDPLYTNIIREFHDGFVQR